MIDLAEYPLDERYAIELLAESTRWGASDVVDLWLGEGAIEEEEEALRRVHEVLHVAEERDGVLVGVSSAYLEPHPQLHLEVWYQRGFVVGSARESNIGMHFAIRGIAHLERAFVTGTDRRGAAVVQEIENPGLKTYFNKGFEPPTDMVFIGENVRGDHVRVHFFPGALAPDPPRLAA